MSICKNGQKFWQANQTQGFAIETHNLFSVRSFVPEYPWILNCEASVLTSLHLNKHFLSAIIKIILDKSIQLYF